MAQPGLRITAPHPGLKKFLFPGRNSAYDASETGRIQMNIFAKAVTSPKVKGIVSIAAAAVMHFTPDNVDRVIEGLLGAFGIGSMFVSKKNDDDF
jgi:hypothetical protein